MATTEAAGTLAEPTRSFMEAMGAGPTTAGVSITESNAEGIPAVFAAVRCLAETVAQTPIKLYRKLPDGNKIPDPSHDLYSIFHDLANPETTASEFKDQMTGMAALWGNAYAEIERRPNGTVKALWPLHPGCMTVDRNGLNQLRYTYRKPGRSEPIVWEWDVQRPPIFHLRFNGGRSPIRVLREHLSTSKALEVYYAALFGNGSRPGGVLQSKEPVKLTPEQIASIRDQWTKLHSGVGNAHKIAVLPGGLQWQAVGMPPEDAQLVELLGLHIEQAASLWRVPLFMIQHTEKSTTWGTGLEQLSGGFLRFTMQPWYIRWQQTIGRDLLTYKSFETHEAIFQTKALERGSLLEYMSAMRIQRDEGIINADEWREIEDMNAQAGDHGKDYWRPSNFVPVDTPMAPTVVLDPAPVMTPADMRAEMVEAIRAMPAPVVQVTTAPVTVHTPPVQVDVLRQTPKAKTRKLTFTRDETGAQTGAIVEEM